MPFEVVSGAAGGCRFRLDGGRQAAVEQQRDQTEERVEQEHAVQGVGQAEAGLLGHELGEARGERAGRRHQ